MQVHSIKMLREDRLRTRFKISQESLRTLIVCRVVLYFFLGLFFIIVPTEYIKQAPSICIFKNIIGVGCFGCGLTRALSSMLHGNLVEAYHYNRLIVIVFPLLSLLCLYYLLILFGLSSILNKVFSYQIVSWLVRKRMPEKLS